MIKIKNHARRLAAVGAVTGILTGGLASAAFASGPSSGGSSVSVSATVASSLTLTGLNNSIGFGAVNPGQTSTAPGVQSYSVSTNDTNGYVLTIQPGASSLTGFNGSIPDSALSVSETSGNGHGGTFNGGSAVTVDSPSTAVSRSYSEDWSLAVPAGQPAGSVSESFTYLALGN